jgi:copper chaperone CopZ
MSMPTKTMIMNWVKSKSWKALEQFDSIKKAEIHKSLIGTEIEDKAKEWDECVTKMQRLYDELQDGNSWKKSLNYNTGEYLRTVLYRMSKEKYDAERKAIENEFNKVIRNLEKLNSPKKMLEYLKACEMEYPVSESIKTEPTFAEVDVTVYKPWIQNQLSSGEGR